MQLPKIITAGIYDSRIASNSAVSKNRTTSIYEIELPMESGGISYIDGESMPITPDMIICVKPGQIRHTKFPFKCHYIHAVIRDPELCNILDQIPTFIAIGRHDEYARIFTDLCTYHNTGAKYDTLKIHSLVLELLYTICQDATKITSHPGKKNSHAFPTGDILQYIQEHLTEDLSLESLSRKMSISPIYFHNSFKASVGMTLRNYVEDLRIKKAIDLLITTNYSLTRIAFECGFSSQSYFSYVFKRKMRKTPREYVKTIYDRYEI